MLSYLKENGFPVTFRIETILTEDTSEGWKGCKSTITDENGDVIDEIYHRQWHDRVLWAVGYLKGIEKR